jgi:stage II sporulation protein D
MRRWSVIAGASALVLAAAATPAAALESFPRPSNGVFTVTGHGFGHGRGMSQYGARGAALSGLTAAQTLSFYYPGTTASSLAAGNTIRVRLLAAPSAALTVLGAAGLTVRDRASGSLTTLASTTARYRIIADAAAMHVQTSADGGASWQPVSLTSIGTSATGPLEFGGPAVIRLVYSSTTARDYEGTLAAVRTGSTTLATVNTLTMERYLNGVVPREMPASWPGVALQVQAVAARTYAANQRAATSPGASWDTCDTTACQVYGGRRLYEGSTVTDLQPASSTTAVTATANQIRSYGGQPIFAQFSASNGGWTVADPAFPYLVAKADPYDAIDNPRATWTTSFTAASVQGCYPAVGTLDSITVLSRDGHGDWGGRVLDVRLDGHDATGHATSVSTTGSGLRVCAGTGSFLSNYFTITSSLAQTASPAGVRRASDGQVDLFARAGDGSLYSRQFISGSGWQIWRWLGGAMVGAPTAERLADGSARVWLRGTNNALYSGDVAADGTWLGYRKWGGTLSSRPYPALLPDGSELVFYRGGDGALWYASFTATRVFTGLHSLGGGLLAGTGPGAAATGPGAVTVGLAGTTGTIYTRSLAGGVWGPWVRRSGGTAHDVAVSSPSAGAVEIDVRGSNGHLYSLRGTGSSFGGWHDDGGILAAGPFAAGVAGRVELYVLAPGPATYLRVRTGTTWGSWTRLPG